MAKKIKPMRKVPSYFKSQTARQAAASGGRSTHPDYFVPAKDTDYWVALLPGHKDHPQNEDGTTSPFVVIERYFEYRMEDGDVRAWPVLSKELVDEGKDPLFRRAARLLSSEDEDDRKLGWKLKAKPRVLMNVLVLAMKPPNGKKTTDVGDFGKKPHIMEVGGTTWKEEFMPLDKDEDEDPPVYFDIFGVEVDTVPIIRIKKASKGSRPQDVSWKVRRTDKPFTIPDKLRKKVIDILAHETNQPCTEEELTACLARAATKEAASSDDLDNVDFDEEDESVVYDEEDTDDVPDPDDDDEEEEKPKRKPKKKAAKKKPAKKKPKKKKEVEEEDEEVDFGDEDEDFFGGDNDDDEEEDDFDDDE